MKKFGIVVLLGLAFSQVVATEQEVSKENKIKAQIQTAFPELKVDSVVQSPVSGLYQLTSGPVVLYASNNGRYVVAGDILDLERLDDRNITEEVRKDARASALKKIQLKEIIVYRPAATKGVVTVFTDPDCGYCRKLHQEIPKLVDLGIEVRYLAFPRQGVGSPTHNKMISVWCAKDPKQAMLHAMEGKEVELRTCQNTVEQQLDLGHKLGINGTPTLIFADGTLWGGYLSAEKLAKEAIKHSGIK